MPEDCFISFVVTTRNDDHGRNMIPRFRIFAEGLLQQANKYGLPGELVVVEWNPPPGPRLHEVLNIETRSDIFAIRFIEVPLEAHRTIRNADVIPLFQMIAKNVGIRRARGEFVLATNPDLIFSNALFSFLASGRLDLNTMYRIDRHDVPSQPPVDTSLDERLAWCDAHVLRIHRRWGSFPPTSKWRRYFQGVAREQITQGLKRTLNAAKFQLGCLGRISWAKLFAKACRIDPRRIIAVTRRRAVYLLRTKLRPTAIRRSHIIFWPLQIAQRVLGIGAQYLGPLPKVHTNGCGDFTLLSRESWFALRGYPELPLWSMHLDALLCYMAVASGLREEVLTPPAKMFHLEHENSWVVLSPEARLKTFGLKPWIDIGLLSELWSTMYLRQRPVEFNGDDWGLGQWSFDEVVVTSGKKTFVKHQRLTALAGTG